MRDLTRPAGSTTVPAWPPRWTGSSRQGDVLLMPGAGVLQSVMRLKSSPVLRLTIVFDANEYTGFLAWDAPPLLDAVERLLTANLGREIRAIGDLDI